MRRSLVLFAPAVAVAIIAACTASDPVLSAAGSTPGTDASRDAASGPTYGIFLTSTTFPNDFGRNEPVDGMRAFVDRQCVEAARRALLDAPEQYRAVIASTLEGRNAADIGALGAALIGVDAGQWCPTVPHGNGGAVDCTSGAIFASPASLTRGPDNSLTVDETGHQVGEPYRFLSGVALTPGATSLFESRIRNCLGWSIQSISDAGADASQAALGSVIRDTYPEGSEYLWMSKQLEPCDDTHTFPLLCIQHP